MSTGPRKPLAQALQDAAAFRSLFADCFEKWEVAGSVRRKKPDVGDIEHVVIPKFVDPQGGLFGGGSPVNAIWKRMDDFESRAMYGITKAVYIDKNEKSSNRWGELYRGVMFAGMKHEIFVATKDNWGAQFLIRTGPGDYSRKVVDKIRTDGFYRQQGGNLIHLASGGITSVPDERIYLNLAGMPWKEPEAR